MNRDNIHITKHENHLFDLINSSVTSIPNRKNTDSVFIFGGWVRDKLLGKLSKDYDVMVSKPILKDFLKNIKNSCHHVSIKQIKLDEYPKIGQILYSVNIKDMKMKLSVTVLEIDLEKELASKDFTINSLCYDVIKRSLIRNRTTAQGMADLEKRVLRTNANIELTLKQAPSRVIRMIRFALEYDFELAKDIKQYFENNKLRQMAKYYSNSFFNQLRKLARYINLEKDKLKECLNLLDKLRVLDLITLWFDYRARRIVVFFIKHDLDKLKDMTRKDQIIRDEHFTTIQLELKDLLHYHQQFIQIKNKRNSNYKL